MVEVYGFEDDGLAEEFFERSGLPGGRPPFEFGRAVCAEHEAESVARRLQFHLVHDLAVAAVEALRDAQKRRPDPHGAASGGGQGRERVVRFLGPPAAVVLRHQRNGLDFLGLETPEAAVADQVVRVLVVIFVRDVPADVVQQPRVFEPFAGAIALLVNAARLVEQRERQAGHVLGMVAIPATPLAEFDDAATPDVRVALRGGDALPVAVDEIEDEPLSQREVAEGDLLGVEQSDHGVEQDRTGDDEVGAARIEAGHAEPLLHVEGDHLLPGAVECLRRNPRVVDGVAVEQPAAGQGHFAEAETGAGRRNHPAEAGRDQLFCKRAELGLNVFDQAPLVGSRQRIARHVSVGQPDRAELKTARQVQFGGGAERHFHRTAADIDDDRRSAAGVHAVDRCLVDEAGLLCAGDHARPDSGLRLDGRQELPSVPGLADGAGGHRQDLLGVPGHRELLEPAQRFQRGLDSGGGQGAAAEAAGAQPDHLLLPVDDVEREVGVHLDDHHVDGVRADVDGGKAHGKRNPRVGSVTVRRLICYRELERAPQSPAPGGSSTIMRSLAVKRAFVRRVRALERELPGALEHDIDALHRSRVASRRLREILPVLGLEGEAARDPEVEKTRKRVRRLTRALGSVRELDVALGILDEIRQIHPDLGEVVVAVRADVEEGRRSRREEMADQLDAIQAAALPGDLASLEEQVGHEPASARSASLRRRLERRADRLDAAIEAAGALYAFDRLHMVRIAVKQLRYTLELIHEFGRVPTRRLVTRLRWFQDLLGRQHDLEIVAGYVRRLGCSGKSPFADDVELVLGVLERETRELHAGYLAGVDRLVDVIARCRCEIDRRLAEGPPGRRHAAGSNHG
jgi:CHAD domain-containing protein